MEIAENVQVTNPSKSNLLQYPILFVVLLAWLMLADLMYMYSVNIG